MGNCGAMARQFLLLCCGASVRAFVAPAPRVRLAPRAAVVAQPLEAFEAAAIVRGAVRVARRFASGKTPARQLVRTAMDLVEPVDIAVIAALYAIAAERGLGARLSRLTRRRRGGDRDAVSARRALGDTCRLLFCRLYPLFYAVDLACAVARAGFGARVPACLQPAVAVVGYSVAGGALACGLKRSLLARALPSTYDHRARFDTLDRVGDIACWGAAAVAGLEAICLQCGLQLASILAFGGVGSLVLGLACQTPLANVVSGVIVAVVDPFDVGDEVDFGDGNAGFVEGMSWYATTLRAYDERMITIPNANIAASNTINLSRMTHQRLTTKLRLRRADAARVQDVVADLRTTLRDIPDTCDELAGGRALRVHLGNWGSETGGPEIEIEAHYVGNDPDDFLAWQHTTLLATHDAIQRQDCALDHDRDVFAGLWPAAPQGEPDSEPAAAPPPAWPPGRY